MKKRALPAFTLAELLIALAILGVIATFTIPKVLQSQQDGKYKSIAKEGVGTISAAYQAYQQQQAVPSTLIAKDLTPYLNYVSYDTASTIDYPAGDPSTCAASTPCLRLHNGGMLQLYGMSFGGTATTNAVWFLLDPDGKPGGPYGFEFALYYNGRIADWSGISSNTVSSDLTRTPNPSKVPSWFSWN